MNWDDAETAIRSHIETQWALSAYASSIPLLWEAETCADNLPHFMFVAIEGNFSAKGVYGSPGKRLSEEDGIVSYSCFGPTGAGKGMLTSAVVAMSTILELQALSNGAIRLDGADPPSPLESGQSELMPGGQPGGMYYRVSASTPFIVIGAR